MPIYQVTLTYLITVEAEDAEDAAQKAYEEVGENPGLYNDIEAERVEEACSFGKKMNFDNIILPEFDENNPDVECIYQTWKNIVKDYFKGEN